MALSDFHFSYNGLTFGKDEPIGLIDAEGLTDLTVALGDSAIPRGSGDVPGLAVAKPRNITLNLKANGAKRSEELADLLDDAALAFRMGQAPLPLRFKEPGASERLVYARVTGVIVPRKPSLTFGHRPFTVRLKAADPRTYSAAEKSETLSVYDASGGGTDYGEDYGIEFVGGSSGEKIVKNLGNADAYPLVRFYGPTSGTVTGVEVTNLTTGKTLDIDSTILNGQILSAEMRRLITVDPGEVPYINLDGSNRYGDWQLPREPFRLAPGDNVLRFEVTGTSTDALCVITYRDTWL